MPFHGGTQNFGYGATLNYAARNALRIFLGDGRFQTRATHAARFRKFVRFAASQGVRDARDVDAALVAAYARALKADVANGRLAMSSAVNLLSTVNVVLSRLRGDRTLVLRPAVAIGRRSSVRLEAPTGIDTGAVAAVAAALVDAGHPRVAMLVRLCRTFGLRFREASLLTIPEALRQADRESRINVVEGTKGGRGRRVDRYVPADADAIAALRESAQLVGSSGRLVPDGTSYIQWYRYCHRVYPRFARAAGLTTRLHELRAAFACATYESLTGQPAPAIAGRRVSERAVDGAARDVISERLGHGRRQVVASYCGSSK
jgi:hypothetical protein